MKRKTKKAFFVLISVAVCIVTAISAFLIAYPRPYRETVITYGRDPALVYAIMKAESGFCETAVSSAGAVGIMQLKPSTAAFVCEREGIAFQENRLTEGEYNTMLGCLYLNYLLGRFSVTMTALAAYNAGEGTVAGWLKNKEYSADGENLLKIPYAETRGYLKKIDKFRKIYQFYD